jgi:Protein of unknown function (DUF3089)
MKTNHQIASLSIALIVALSSCMAPKSLYETYSAPDYSVADNWAALPTKADKADIVPKNCGLGDYQEAAKADVFFVHYTSYWVTPFKRNAKLNNKLANMTTNGCIKRQATVFNESCKVYAPRYRQASIISFLDQEGKGKKAFELAYKDVKEAFEYYLKNNNNGRPFIIASHSQGSIHAQRLIQEMIETDSVLYKRFICAYLPGWANTMTNTKAVPCDSASQIGCVNSWQTVRWATTRKDRFPNNVIFVLGNSSVNPLSWTPETTYMPAENNKGGVPLFMNTIHPGVCDAQLENNLLWIHKPKKSGYMAYLFHYHLFDYSLFYMNVRENATLRVNTFLQRSKYSKTGW